MKKTVYLSIFPLTAQLERYLLIQDVIKAGIVVEYWDLSRIYSKGVLFENEIPREFIKKYHSLGDLKDAFRKECPKEAVFIAQVNLNAQVLSLFFMLTRFQCKSVFFALLPPSLPISFVDRVLHKIRRFSFSINLLVMVENAWVTLCRKAGFIKGYDLVFAVGQLAADAFRGQSRVVKINYTDYDQFLLTSKDTASLVTGDYCVFLDGGSIAGEDNRIAGFDFMDPEKYYGSLKRFFSDVEKKFNLKVIIAAHPGIAYDQSTFGGRAIYTGKTCALVKDSKFVISQGSMAVSFAVLFKKPIVFVYTDEYRMKRASPFMTMEFFANILNLAVINMESRGCAADLAIPEVDQSGYDNYKYAYLTSKESEEQMTKDIVIKTLKEI